MRIALFLCNNQTLGECYERGLFGTNAPYGLQVRNGDLCLLYNYSDNSVYGVWIARSNGGNHVHAAWQHRYPNQVRVDKASETIIRVPRHKIPALHDLDAIGRIYDGNPAQEILQHFAAVYTANVETRESAHIIEDDFRNRYPANFFCDDGHRVRSQGEKIIDDWLRRHSVQHDYEPIVAIPGLLPDFVVRSRNAQPIFIEYWGMTDPQYEARRLHKCQIYARFMLPLIELYPQHLQIIDATLTRELRNRDVHFQ